MGPGKAKHAGACFQTSVVFRGELTSPTTPPDHLHLLSVVVVVVVGVGVGGWGGALTLMSVTRGAGEQVLHSLLMYSRDENSRIKIGFTEMKRALQHMATSHNSPSLKQKNTTRSHKSDLVTAAAHSKA